MVNYCGYSGSGFFAKLTRKLITDAPFGVYIGQRCKCHDRSWDKEANKRGDLAFKNGINEDFEKAKYIIIPFSEIVISSNFRYFDQLRKTLGFIISNVYYIGVRFGGIPYKISNLLKGS